MRFYRSTIFAAALLGTSALMTPAAAMAQSVPAPKFTSPDQNNVDLTTGLVWYSMEEGGIGSGPGRLSMQRIWAESAGWLDNWSGGLYPVSSGGTTKMYVQFGGISDTFSGSGTSWTSDKADGATLTVDGQGLWHYTSRDGTNIEFDAAKTDAGTFVNTVQNCPGSDPSTCQVPLSITQPSGLTFYLGWDSVHLCQNLPGEPCAIIHTYQRLSAVTSSAGYQLAIGYASDSIGTWPNPNPDWFKRTAAGFSNGANPPPSPVTINYSFGTNTISVTDPASRTWVFTTDTSGRLTGIRRPGSAADNISYTYGTSGTISSATKDGIATSYGRSVVGTTATETLTDPLSQQTVVTSNLSIGRPTSYKDPLNRTTSYQYDANARLTRITQPESNYTQFDYDGRGNVTTTTNVAKSGSGLANIVTSASFDSTCTNVVKCNKPNSTTDAKGNVTNYTYDSTHGGVLTITQPAPTTGAVQPQTRFTYAQVTGAGGDLVYMPTRIAACQTLASCTNAADETQANIAYNSNLLPTSLTRQNGTGTVSATNAMTYDSHGNTITVDGPLSGTADTWAYKYDMADQMVGAISPDPDGAGSLVNRAIRLTYRPDGQVSKQEIGTTAGQTDSAWSAFAPLQTVDIGFDSNSRPVTSKLSASSTDYSLTQTSYDSLGRTSCTAVRMNTAIYGSLPTSACTLGTQGSFGPDRISQNSYDAASELTSVTVAVGTTDAATERTLSYTTNSMLATLKDGENNLTTFEYDGFDRLSKTRYPLPTKGSNASSTTDYEQLTYDANGNVTAKRLRDTNSIGFTYDNLNRVTLKDLPGTEPDVSYAYDNLGRPTSAAQSGNSLAFAYDALSRMTSETGPQGTTGSAYDAAGRRIQLTYPGTGLFVNYDYLLTGELSAIRENGATSGSGVLATYSYDDLGNRTGIVWSNTGGYGQNFGYDPISRLASLTSNPVGAASDLVVNNFIYNPADQVTQVIYSTDAYMQTKANGTQTTVTNGLNEVATVNGTSATYDAKGNFTVDPVTAKSYAYSSENLLTIASGGTGLSYDPELRLYEVAGGGAATRFAYDGMNAIAEYDASNALRRRFVFDDRGNPVIWYEGADLSQRRFLAQGELGSVITVADGAANAIAIDTYDEYGIPSATNIGRFQYTGQMWIGEAGVYAPTYRALFAHLGRYGQTDPVGFAGGMNFYVYVGGDPVNRTDPLGLYWECRMVEVTTEGVGSSSNWRCEDNGIDLAGRYEQLIGFWERNIKREGNEVGFDVSPCSGTVTEVKPKSTAINAGASGNSAEATFSTDQFNGIPGHLHNPDLLGRELSPVPGPSDNGLPRYFGQAFVGTSRALWSVSYASGKYSIGIVASNGSTARSVINSPDINVALRQLISNWNSAGSSPNASPPSESNVQCANAH